MANSKQDNDEIGMPSIEGNFNTKWKVIKNTIFLFLIFFANFTAYMSIQLLQTSVNGNIGVYSMTLFGLCKLFSSFFGPFIVNLLTPKWTLFCSSFCILIYVVANLFPRWYILMPCGGLMGKNITMYIIMSMLAFCCDL